MLVNTGKLFTTVENLYQHIRTHTEKKPYVCEQCGKSFITQTKLSRHIRVHTREKPYDCDHCGKSFSQQSHLRDILELIQEKNYMLVNSVASRLSHSRI